MNDQPSKQRDVVVITGTSRGLGRALAMAFAQEGADLVLHARSREDLNVVATEAAAAGAGSVTSIVGDLLSPDLGRRLARAAQENYGRIDLLILNAAVLGPMAPLIETPPDDFAHVMRVNVDSQVPIVAATLPIMRAQGAGKIIWMSSGLGRFGLPRYGVYCASKHAVEGLMKVAAAEHREAGVINVSVAPGMVQTEMLKRALLGADTTPYQTPEDTASAFVRLCAGLTPAQNGQALDIEGWL